MKEKRKETLFNKPKRKFINTYDLYGNLLKQPSKTFRFRLSVYGLLVEDQRLLFQINPHIQELCIPGGGVELDETMEIALKREFLEETGFQIDIIKQLIAIEDFFTYNGNNAHSILVFYLVKRKPYTNKVNIITKSESSGLKFVKISNLDKEKIQRVARTALDKIIKHGYLN